MVDVLCGNESCHVADKVFFEEAVSVDKEKPLPKDWIGVSLFLDDGKGTTKGYCSVSCAVEQSGEDLWVLA